MTAPDTTHWTCGRCGVEVSWMAGREQRGLPANWIEEEAGLVCLACRREVAGDAAVSAAPADVPVQQRARLRSHALIDFEVRRDPSRSNGEIAHAVRTSVGAIQQARDRLGIPAADLCPPPRAAGSPDS